MQYTDTESTTETMHQTGSESTTGTNGAEVMVVDFTTVVGKPLVRKDSDRIVISNLAEPSFPIGDESVPLPNSKLKELIRGMKRLGQDGDRKGPEEYERKRKDRAQVENRRYRVPLTYLIKIGREKDRETFEIEIRFMRNFAKPAKCRYDPKGSFRVMTDEEVDTFMDMFLTQCANELTTVLDEEYERARMLGVEFDYLNLPGQSKHANI